MTKMIDAANKGVMYRNECLQVRNLILKECIVMSWTNGGSDWSFCLDKLLEAALLSLVTITN